MQQYMIRRRTAWKTVEELEAAGQRSDEVAEADFPDDISWIRSYVVSETSGELGTVCIYEATSEDVVREHARRAGIPADEVLSIADTVVHRPDPQPTEA